MINTLIALVLSLLVQVQSPNVPVQLKLQALEIANQILLVAQAEQNAQTPTQPTEATTTPPAEPTATSTDTSSGLTGNVGEGSTTTPPAVGDQAAADQAPTCSLTAQAVAVSGLGWRAQFTWWYTQGAYATISSGGKVILYPNKGSTFNTSALDPNPTYYLFGPTDYEMDVTLNGLTGSCTASTTIPTSN